MTKSKSILLNDTGLKLPGEEGAAGALTPAMSKIIMQRVESEKNPVDHTHAERNQFSILGMD